jgi:ethanolamine utilization protein EutN
MKLGLVIGNVVATRKAGRIDSLKLLMVRYLNEQYMPTKASAVCIDTVGAGAGDVVLICASSSARLTATTKNVAADSAIVGIVDLAASGAPPVQKPQPKE